MHTWLRWLGIATLAASVAPVGCGASARPREPARSNAAGAIDGAPKASEALAQIVSRDFDIDDNILVLPTRIWLKGDAGETRGISSQDWAIAGHLFAPAAGGTRLTGSGDYRGFAIPLDRKAPDFGFRDFNDARSFRADVTKAVEASETAWRGPVWSRFAEAMRSPASAENAHLITARGHTPGAIHDGLEELQRRGYVANLLPATNIFPVQDPTLKVEGQPLVGDTATKKAFVMTTLLDAVQKAPLGAEAAPVVTPDGRGHRAMHLWEFSDDDYANYGKAVAALGAEVKKSRWPNVKIRVIFTGTNHPTEKPRTVVLQDDGTPRPQLESEASEPAP